MNQPASAETEANSRESLDFELLYLIEKEPGLSQREIAERLGISLGKANYCLRALTRKGALKLGNFRASKSKLRYAYVLTPQGISQRLGMTQRFLQRKLREYERLKAQIETLERELPGQRRGGGHG
jgi:EPS-associated MarR family transcriptional regulator